ncbi:hypothetical protein [Candidatus Venteria ishoeyi]|uniref:hypothetical protein n=1 Tax=Candidatus Venteria ishoeyi TaxID=1899563 RepID=UPI0015AFED7F|nr:hypothetical protein [Candidatus Venteria ishoeyi]
MIYFLWISAAIFGLSAIANAVSIVTGMTPRADLGAEIFGIVVGVTMSTWAIAMLIN